MMTQASERVGRLARLQKAAIQQRERRSRYENNIKENKENLRKQRHRAQIVEESRTVYLETIRLSRQTTIDSVQAIATQALHHIFGDPTLELIIDTVERRGLEADYSVQWKSSGILSKEHPHDCDGGAVSDVLTTAFRMIFLKCHRPAKRPILFLDEPGKFIDQTGRSDRRERYAQWLAEASRELGIQLVIVSHDGELIEIADVLHEFSQNANKETTVVTTKR